MSLNASIQNLLTFLQSQVPPPVFAKLQQVFDRLETARTGANAPEPGDHAPDAELLTEDGTKVPLRSLYRDTPLVLMFYRGRWCPFCDLSLRAFNGIVDGLHEAGARLVAVSPQTAAETALTAEERSLRFDVLSDPHNTAAKAFGLTWDLTEEERQLYQGFHAHLDESNGDEDWRLPAPAVFVIDVSGKVRWSYVDSNWTRRAEPLDVLHAARNLNLATQTTA